MGQVTVEELAAGVARRPGRGRTVVAIAGPPGSGKSTVSDRLQEMLCQQFDVSAQVVPMDGFHYDNAILEQLDLTQRKGAPQTFDVGGLEATLRRLVLATGKEDVAVPVFDRDLDVSRAGARLIDRNTRVLLVEGNYLLLKRAPWSRLLDYFDVTVMIECDEPTLRARLMQRWLDHGFSEADARLKVESNDLPNARLVATESHRADHFLA